MFEDLKTLASTLETAKKEVAEKGKNAIHSAFKELFDAHPSLQAVCWRQYTPYFNDGDACVFGVHDPAMKLDGTTEEQSDYDDEGFIDCWAVKDDRKPIGDAVRSLFKLAGREVMEIAFGDHVKVTASRTGFDIDEYNHD